MTAPRGAQPSTARTARKPATKPAQAPPETLEQAAHRIANAAPVLGGEKHDLIEVARAAGAYRRELMAQGFTQLETMAMVSEWHGARWAIAQDEAADDDDAEAV